MPINKPVKLHLLTIIITCVFSEGGKFYPQLFLDGVLFVWVSVKMLHYKKIDVSEGIDINKTSLSKECELCHFGILKMFDLNLNHMFVMDIMFY